MDGARFDTWTRRLSSPGSRRSVLRALVGGWLAASGVLAGGAPVLGAPCKGPGKGCDKNGDCCRGLTCKGGNCACQGGAKACGEACCETNEQCLGQGQAKACCPAAKVCDGECCGPHKVCVCPKPPDIPGVPPDPDPPCFCRCEDGWTDDGAGDCKCDTTLCGLECCEEAKGERCCNPKSAATCTNIRISRKHCGECGNACPEHLDCVGGECRCPFDRTDCGGKCVKLATNRGHCGQCGHACYDGHDCVNGRCQCKRVGASCRDDEECCMGGQAGSRQAIGRCYYGECHCCPVGPDGDDRCTGCFSGNSWLLLCQVDGGTAAECCTPGPDCDDWMARFEEKCLDTPTIRKPGLCNE